MDNYKIMFLCIPHDRRILKLGGETHPLPPWFHCYITVIAISTGPMTDLSTLTVS